MEQYPTPSNPSNTDKPLEQSTAAHLESLSSTIVSTINARDFNFTSPSAQDFLTHLSPSWRGEIDTFTHKREITCFDEQRSLWKQRAEQHPNVHFEIVHLWSCVNEEVGLANVYMNMEVTGVGERVVLHAMNELRWKRVEGRWVCWYTIGMRGSAGNSGGLG